MVFWERCHARESHLPRDGNAESVGDRLGVVDDRIHDVRLVGRGRSPHGRIIIGRSIENVKEFDLMK
jgi:hypothetical protein